MSRYLVVAHQTAGSPELRRHVADILRHDPVAEFSVLVPATPVSHLFTWSEQETLALARENMDRSAQLLRETGATVTRTSIGSRFPADAIADEVRDNPGYDSIIICTFPPGVSRWLKLDLVNQARKRTGLDVVHVMARPASREEAVPAAAGATAASSSARAPYQPPPPLQGLSEDAFAHLDLPYIEREDLPVENRELWDRLVEGRDVANLFRLMGNNRVLLQAYVEMLNALWNESGLDDQTRELVILRVALLQRNEYLWHHHVPIACELGLSDDVIRTLEHWQSSELVLFDERQRTILSFVDGVARDRRPAPSSYEALAHYYPLSAIIGLTLVVGFYRMTASFASTLDVELEERFIGWNLY